MLFLVRAFGKISAAWFFHTFSDRKWSCDATLTGRTTQAKQSPNKNLWNNHLIWETWLLLVAAAPINCFSSDILGESAGRRVPPFRGEMGSRASFVFFHLVSTLQLMIMCFCDQVEEWIHPSWTFIKELKIVRIRDALGSGSWRGMCSNRKDHWRNQHFLLISGVFLFQKIKSHSLCSCLFSTLKVNT